PTNSTTRSAFERSLQVLNLNRASLSLEPINTAINVALERAAKTAAELPRPYLGASIVGSECLRRVQYDWWCSPVLSARPGPRAPPGSADGRAAVCCRVQVRPARGACLHRRQWRPARARRRRHPSGAGSARRLSDLLLCLGMQGAQRQKLARTRARRT